MVLAGLLIAFSVWCMILFWRSNELRRDLDHHLGWIEDLHRLRGDLNRPVDDAGTQPDLIYRPSRLHQRRGDPQLQVAVRGLRGALDQLRASHESRASVDDVWEAASAARTAAATLEGHVQGQVSALRDRLDDHWTEIYVLIVASLLLAGSNLGLLHLARQRRLRLEQAHAEAVRRATHDPLTRVWNRDAIQQLLRRELARAERQQTPLGVILVDVDDFQQINVLLGEDQGDFILEQLAERFGRFVRPYDTMGRFGGDAFLVVLPVCDDLATGGVAERLRRAINERDFEHALGHIRVTVSLAFATVADAIGDGDGDGDGTDADLLIHRLQERIVELQAEGRGRMAKLGIAS